MSRILLLLDQKENRQLLADELASTHDVVAGSGDAELEEEFDLCVVDGRALDRLWERVLARKQAEQPILLPVLLVTSRPDVKMITRHVWRSVDELIITPIEKPELSARIQILLRARALSLALRQRADDAERATRTRDEVLAMVSHDLRNPLNIVLTSGSFLLETETELEPRSRDQLEMILRATRQMNRLIGDLLEVAGMEAGHLPIDAALEDVESMVQEACDLQQHAAAARSIALSCHVDENLPRVCADRHRIHQVLGNLLGNALKFTPEGGTVSVRAERAGDFVRVSVQDTGRGISEEDRPHVFDRFWQASREHDGGAGLGLAISRSIITSLGGEIHVESEPGQGSTFSFTLPIEDAAG